MPAININSDAIVVFAAKLERIRKSALPVAIRRTVNSAALDVKTVTMPDESDRDFHKRKPTFFRATSKVDMARGLNIDSMAAIVGFVAPDNAKESGHATQDLEQQEHGGDIDKRAYIATDQGRTGKGNVKADLMLSKIKNLIFDSKNTNIKAKNNKERFIIAALYAKTYGGYVIGNQTYKNGNRHLYKVSSVIRAGGNTHVATELIYNVKGGRKAHVKATHFMRKASELSGKKMEKMFIDYATQEINKVK